MSKSNPVHLWRFGRTTALIFTQKWLNRAKTGVLHGTLKNFPRSNKSVSRVYGTQLTKINWKIKNISSGLVTRRLYFFQKRATFWTKFPSWGIWPIWRENISLSWLDTEYISMPMESMGNWAERANYMEQRQFYCDKCNFIFGKLNTFHTHMKIQHCLALAGLDSGHRITIPTALREPTAWNKHRKNCECCPVSQLIVR